MIVKYKKSCISKSSSKAAKLIKSDEPVRMCISCQRREPKKNLVRVVFGYRRGLHSSEDSSNAIGEPEILSDKDLAKKIFTVDRGMTEQCRGAYIHPTESCIGLLECSKRGSRALTRVLGRVIGSRSHSSRRLRKLRVVEKESGSFLPSESLLSGAVAKLVEELRSLDAS